jgi:Tfp pilus assembly protein PilZ
VVRKVFAASTTKELCYSILSLETKRHKVLYSLIILKAYVLFIQTTSFYLITTGRKTLGGIEVVKLQNVVAAPLA